jgi:hypothetical protein
MVTCPHEPQPNGVVERKHRHVMCSLWPLTIPSENQLVSNEKSQSLLLHSKSYPTRYVLRAVHVNRMTLLHSNNSSLNVTLLRLDPMTLALIPFVGSGL